MENKDYQELANQLRCPSGNHGVFFAERMYRSNNNMIFKTIDHLPLYANTTILEIGFASGRHVPYLLKKSELLHYIGLEISDLMIEKANDINSLLVENKKASFQKAQDQGTLAFANESIDHCFSVNTLYFWHDPARYLYEIHRVLKLGGTLTLSFIEKSFGEKLPFTKYNFQFYPTDLILRLMRNIGFANIEKWEYKEQTKNNLNQQVIRPFIILKGVK